MVLIRTEKQRSLNYAKKVIYIHPINCLLLQIGSSGRTNNISCIDDEDSENQNSDVDCTPSSSESESGDSDNDQDEDSD